MDDPFRTQSDAAAGGENGPAGADPADVNPVDALIKQLAELRAYAQLYLEARADQVKVALRNGLILAALAIVALVSLATALVVAVALALVGVARGLGALLGDRLWAGELITGALVMAAAGGAAYFGIRSVTKTSKRKITEKYERRRQDLRKQFGHDLPAQEQSGATV